MSAVSRAQGGSPRGHESRSVRRMGWDLIRVTHSFPHREAGGVGKGFAEGPSHSTAGEDQAQGTGLRARAPGRRLAGVLPAAGERGPDLPWGGAGAGAVRSQPSWDKFLGLVLSRSRSSLVPTVGMQSWLQSSAICRGI